MRRSKLQRTDGSRELARCAGADIFSPAERRPGAGHDGRQGRFCGDLLPNGRRRPRSYTCGEGGRPGPRVRNASSISHQPAKLAYACAFLRIPP